MSVLYGISKEQAGDYDSFKENSGGVGTAEYFRIKGKEITTVAELRDNPVLFLYPSGNSFVYTMLSWVMRTPLREEPLIPASRLCSNHLSGQRCIYEEGHEGKCKTLVFAEF